MWRAEHPAPGSCLAGSFSLGFSSSLDISTEVWASPRQPPSAAASVLTQRGARPEGTVLASPRSHSPWVYLLHERKLFSRPLCHSASRHSQDVGTEPYFIFYICKSHFILYRAKKKKKKTYLFSDLQYVSYPSPLYFVDFTNKVSSFGFFPQRECVWSF